MGIIAPGNIIINAYAKKYPATGLKPIKSGIKVRTQFKHMLDADNTTRDQDIKIIDSNDGFVYIEFQIRANTKPPIEIRSVEYFGLAIGHSAGKTADQIWLLAENADTVLHGETFARYILKDEATGKLHPEGSGILYVSLARLSNEKGAAKELAMLLLGKPVAPKSSDVKKIAKTFDTSFSNFKVDKDVVKVLTLAERYRNDGMVEGEARGEARGVSFGAARMLELIESGLSPEEALIKVEEEQKKLQDTALQATE